MNRFDFAALAATLTLALSPTIASAEPDRRSLTTRVAIHDIELDTAAGQLQFRDRVHRAAARACGHGMDIRERLDVLRCQREMRDDAQVRLAALTRARKIELAALARH